MGKMAFLKIISLIASFGEGTHGQSCFPELTFLNDLRPSAMFNNYKLSGIFYSFY